MKKYIMLAVFIVTTSHSRAERFWCPSDNSLRSPRPVGAECFPVADSFNPETAEVATVGGVRVVVVSPSKEAEFNAKELLKRQKQDRAAQAAAECAELYQTIDDLSNINEAKDILQCLAGLRP